MLNVRKLAAIDLHFLGRTFILVEFALGVIGCGALGLITLRSAIQRGQSTALILLGAYLLALAINYVPLLIYAISLARSGRAQSEIADELLEPKAAMRKYRRQSLLILVPFAVVIAGVREELRKRQLSKASQQN